jgi:hypothetical protein
MGFLVSEMPPPMSRYVVEHIAGRPVEGRGLQPGVAGFRAASSGAAPLPPPTSAASAFAPPVPKSQLAKFSKPWFYLYIHVFIFHAM